MSYFYSFKHLASIGFSNRLQLVTLLNPFKGSGITSLIKKKLHTVQQSLHALKKIEICAKVETNVFLVA
ncbi:hypothetical protein DOY81_005266 [Sarcophaga bullata]|nr:hypothetical protein DOY81_005266 [Sarcophaga bullata]